MIRSILSAFLMYSRIPVPKVEWNEKNRRYVLGAFPLVGAVIGGMVILLKAVFNAIGVGSMMFACFAAVLPIVITGGIHLDGFCDVSDALSSYGDRQKRLDIMRDPHIGAFAVIRLVTLIIAEAGLFSQIKSVKELLLPSLGYVLSRALSGLLALTLRPASDKSSLVDFIRAADKKVNICMDAAFAAAASVGMVLIEPFSALCCIIAAGFTAEYFKHFVIKNFGGVTGDLCGWFLQLCEFWILAAAVFSNTVSGVIK